MKKYTDARYPDKINDLVDNEGQISEEAIADNNIATKGYVDNNTLKELHPNGDELVSTYFANIQLPVLVIYEDELWLIMRNFQEEDGSYFLGFCTIISGEIAMCDYIYDSNAIISDIYDNWYEDGNRFLRQQDFNYLNTKKISAERHDSNTLIGSSGWYHELNNASFYPFALTNANTGQVIYVSAGGYDTNTHCITLNGIYVGEGVARLFYIEDCKINKTIGYLFNLADNYSNFATETYVNNAVAGAGGTKLYKHSITVIQETPEDTETLEFIVVNNSSSVISKASLRQELLNCFYALYLHDDGEYAGLNDRSATSLENMFFGHRGIAPLFDNFITTVSDTVTEL